MARYSKDENLKFQVKFQHENYGFSIPLIAALQGISRATAHFRYDSISNEIEIYEDVRSRYEEYLSNISKCTGVAVLLFRLRQAKPV